MAEIENGVLEFAKRFPHSKKKEHFTKLEGRKLQKRPNEVLFYDYEKQWWKEMSPGMNASKQRDYISILNFHIIPYFSDKYFNEINRVCIKKFVALLKNKKNRFGKPLSAKSIQNILIPLRIIVNDAIDEYHWTDFYDPFARLKLPKVKKTRVCPFTFEEWKALMTHMLSWYKSYFEFAIQTGLRPSEQVALKWDAIDDEFVHIQLSRVRNREKEDLKNEASRRSIPITPSILEVLRRQKDITASFDSPYVFINTMRCFKH